MCFIKLIRDEGRMKGEKKESKVEERKYMREERRGRKRRKEVRKGGERRESDYSMGEMN